MVGPDADGGYSHTQSRDARRRGARNARRDLAVGPLTAWSHDLDEQRRELLAGVGHELKTPLSIVLGLSARLLADEALNDNRRDDVERIRANAYVLLKRVEDALAIARLDSGTVRLALRDIDVATLVRESCAGFASVAELRQQRLVVDVPRSVRVRVDDDRILSVVSNLLANALKHAPVGGTVRCTVASDGRRLRIEVADSGPGVAEGLRSEVFERYRQGAVAGPGGTGLGLAIVSEVVVLHGGTVTLTEAPEGGALFVVDLPLQPWAGTPGEEQRSPVDVAERQRTTVERLRAELAAPREDAGATGAEVEADVLVVAADAQLGDYLHQLVGGRYRVRHAADVAAAVSGELERPDVILFDADVGHDALTMLRRRMPDVPVLAFAAGPQDLASLLDAGATDWVVKPFAAEDLRARLSVLLAGSRGAAVTRALDQVFAAAPVPTALITREGRLVRVSQALCALMDMAPEELRQRTVHDLTHPADRPDDGEAVSDWRVCRLVRADGSVVTAHVVCSAIGDAADHLLWQLAELPAEQATGTPPGDAISIASGRRSFERSVHHQLLRCRRYGEQAVLVRCSLGDLGQVRAEHGDAVAERLLALVTYAVRGRLRDTDLVARLDEDEIGALLMHAGPEVQRGAAEAIRMAVEGESVDGPDGPIVTHAVVGVSSLAAAGTVGRAFLEAGGDAPLGPLRLDAREGQAQALPYLPGLVGDLPRD
jgi:GGDEF domain-containing protein/CheY-like chemotaxis protein/two-component sensor histidine kinase